MFYPENTADPKVYEAGEDLSSAFGLFVKPGATPLTVLKSTASGAITFGVVIEPGAAGKGVAVCDEGYLYVKAEAASYAIGQELTVSGNAKIEAAATGDHVYGVALETVTISSGGSLYIRLYRSSYKK
jgi:hypothetical protein